ncbi:MAG: hypothetical protein DDT19_02159 [Syntrophomonadaceae bacterium]|nr:hypothetical protein [Bacillota bacterium]
MAVILNEWLELIDKEYLRDFIVKGGAAVKFVVADNAGIAALDAGLVGQAAEHGLVFARVSSADVKLHMMQQVFFAVSRQIDWEADAQRFVEGLFQRQGYLWPSPGEPVVLKDIAEANRMDAILLHRDINKWLTRELMKDTSMAQDFRLAVTQLCLNRLAPADHGGESVAPILQWLRGELRLLGPLKNANIYSKITRHNARAMLRSLCRWLILAGRTGLFLAVDIRGLTLTAPPVEGILRYTSAAVMDAYEVLRQLVDDADMFDHFFVAVFADHAFIGDDRKRSVSAYTALKMRIWDDVRAQAKSNPLAPMVVIENGAG